MENNRLHEEIIMKREENSNRFQMKRDQVITEQEVNWSQKHKEKIVFDSFAVDSKPFQLAQKPKTRAERKEK